MLRRRLSTYGSGGSSVGGAARLSDPYVTLEHLFREDTLLQSLLVHLRNSFFQAQLREGHEMSPVLEKFEIHRFRALRRVRLRTAVLPVLRRRTQVLPTQDIRHLTHLQRKISIST